MLSAGRSRWPRELQHDKRALELGALPPLDIYRSQSEVAARRLQAIQSEYALKQARRPFGLPSARTRTLVSMHWIWN